MGSFKVEDIFHITGRGWMVTGKGLTGEIVRGDIVHTDDEEERQYTIIGIERFVRSIGVPVRPGDSAGLLLREMKSREEIPSGTVLTHYDYVL